MNSPTRSSLLWPCLFLAAIVALAALLRGMCLSAELWLDEVWSVEFARAAQTPWQIFAGEHHHHDNNHKLNTLYLYFVPNSAPFELFRLHSFVAGIASVLLAFRAAARRGVLVALFAALLVAVNYWFVLCAAEARGYALALLFALAAFDGLQRYLRDGGRWYLGQFQLAVILGFLAHLTFLTVYLALAVWTVYHFARNRATKGPELVQLVRVHTLPACLIVLLYMLDVRRMEFGGAPPMSPEEKSEVFGRLLSLGSGLDVPLSFPKVALAVIGAFAVLARGIRLLRRERDDAWVFFGMAIVGAPLMLLIASRPGFIYERYFFLPFLFFLILFAYVLADLARQTLAGRIVAAVVLGLISVGNFGEVMGFVEKGGRGNFRDALQYIADQSDGAARMTSDSDVRVPKMLTFYRPYVQPRPRIEYVSLDDWKKQASLCGLLAGTGGRILFSKQHAPEWLLIERPEHGSRPAEKLVFPEEPWDTPYEMVALYEVEAWGGWDWYVYRRVGVTP